MTTTMWVIKTDKGYSSAVAVLMSGGKEVESPDLSVAAFYVDREIAEMDLATWHDMGRTDARIVELTITEEDENEV